MIVMKNKFIPFDSAFRGQHLGKAGKREKENQNAFWYNKYRMRFSFVPIAGGTV